MCANIMSVIPVPMMRRKPPRVLSSSEDWDLLRCTEGEQEHAILAVLLDTGIRFGKFSLNYARQGGAGRNFASGKTGDRIVPISQNVLELLKEQADERGLWIRCQRRLLGWGLQQIVRRIMRHAGFKAA